MKRGGFVLMLLVTLVVIVGSMASAAQAVDPYVVDSQECDRNGGQATVPAGVPVSVQNFAFVTGTYGLMQAFLLKQQTIEGYVRGGTPTLTDATDDWSEPQQLGANPARGWITRLPDIELQPLASGETVLAGTITEFSGPLEIVFAPVGQVDFGPFHLVSGEQFVSVCAITAS